MEFSKYTEKLNNTLINTNEDILKQIFEVLSFIIKNQGTVILCGNGGSFANSLHIAGDYHKTFAKHNVDLDYANRWNAPLFKKKVKTKNMLIINSFLICLIIFLIFFPNPADSQPK